MNKLVYIHRFGASYYDAALDADNTVLDGQFVLPKQPDLKDELKRVCEQNFRRIDRYTQLALLGAGRCLVHTRIEPNTPLYLATGKGPAENNIAMQQSLVKDKQVPKPIQFINAVSNSVCYYIMKAHQLHGQGLLISRQTHAFEAALTLAIADIQLGNSASALLGIVDEITHPLAHQRKRMGLTADTSLGEGSHWLLLSGEKSLALASITSNEKLNDANTLCQWLNEQLSKTPTSNSKPASLYFDASINTQTAFQIENTLNFSNNRVHSIENVWQGVTAGLITSFLKTQNNDQPVLINISHQSNQRFLATVVMRCCDTRI